MKASDIPDDTFLSLVREYNEGRAPDYVIPARLGRSTDGPFDIPEYVVTGPRWALVHDVAERLDFPEKVVRAKARSLIERGLMSGCACGCRGDFELPEYAYPNHRPAPRPPDHAATRASDNARS